METKPKIKCIKNNLAVRACIVASCQSPSLMCDQSKCQCNKLHEECMFDIQLHSLLTKMNFQGRKYLTVLEQIRLWYQNIIKTITRQIQGLDKIINNAAFCLEGQQGNLYQLICKHKTQQILPSSVYDSVMRLGTELRRKNFNQRFEQVKKSLTKNRDNIKDDLDEIRQFWKVNYQDQLTYQFSSTLKSDQINRSSAVLISNQINNHMNNRMNHYANTYQQSYRNVWGLIQPAISKLKSKRIFRFKNKTNSPQVAFGICHQKIMKNLSYEAGMNYNNGVYGLTQGQKVSHINQQQSNNGTSFRPYPEVQVQYDPKRKEITFCSKNNNQRQTIKFQIPKDDELYLCVGLLGSNCQVQFLGIK